MEPFKASTKATDSKSSTFNSESTKADLQSSSLSPRLIEDSAVSYEAIDQFSTNLRMPYQIYSTMLTHINFYIEGISNKK